MSLFNHIAADDDRKLVIQRTATAVANKRVKDRFEAFFANATDADRVARLALVEDDIKTDVQSVVDEYGGDAERITSAIMRSLSGAEHLKEFQFKKKDAGDEEAEIEDEEPDVDEEPGLTPTDSPDYSEEERQEQERGSSVNPKVASVKEARRPKMCPYHSEVTDISLGTGDAQAGYNAMSSQAWGDKHCKGGFDGSCNFKPAMVTKQYWDDKKVEYEERARQRELDEQKIVEPIVPDITTEPIMNAQPLPDAEGEGVTDINAELSEAPSAVGEMVFANHTAADAPKGAGGAVKRVKLPSADESGLGGPSPKIDKGTWTGLDPIDTETSGTPHPTVQQDVDDGAHWERLPDDYPFDSKDFLDQTDAVTEHQDLPANGGDAGFDDGSFKYLKPTETWTEDNGTNPVTHEVQSATYEGNPLRDLMETDFHGFLPASEVDRAISDFEG